MSKYQGRLESIFNKSPSSDKERSNLRHNMQKIRANLNSKISYSALKNQDLKSPSSSEQMSPRKSISPLASKECTPIRVLNTKNDSIFTIKSLNTSKQTLEKLLELDQLNYSIEDTLYTQTTSTEKNASYYRDCELELRFCKQEIHKLNEKLRAMQESIRKKEEPKKKAKNKNKKASDRTSKELGIELKKQQTALRQQFKQILEQRENDLKCEYSQEFEKVYGKMAKKLKKQQSQSILSKEKELMEKFKCEVELIEMENEAKIKTRINDISSEYERNMIRLQEENSRLKQQLESQKRKNIDGEAKHGIEKFDPKIEEKYKISNLDENKQYNQLYKMHAQLQIDYLDLKKTNLCTKCKVFTQKEAELSKKMIKIREYLNSNS